MIDGDESSSGGRRDHRASGRPFSRRAEEWRRAEPRSISTERFRTNRRTAPMARLRVLSEKRAAAKDAVETSSTCIGQVPKFMERKIIRS